MRHLSPFALLLAAAPLQAAAEDPAFLAGDRFVYERTAFDAAGVAGAPGTVTWEVLESTAAGHLIRIAEPLGGETVTTDWRFDRANNALWQQVGRCRIVNEPHAGRYSWPLREGAAWTADYEVSEVDRKSVV